MAPAPRVAGSSLGERLLLAYQAVFSAGRCVPAAQVADTARRALGSDGLLSAENSAAFCFAGFTLAYADRFDEALEQLARAIDQARASGTTPMLVLALWMRSNVHYRRGSLAQAETDARGALAAEEWFTARSRFSVMS